MKKNEDERNFLFRNAMTVIFMSCKSLALRDAKYIFIATKISIFFCILGQIYLQLETWIISVFL